MHCPQCGQRQVSEETRFCSRCGFLLTGVAEVMANRGLVPGQKTSITGASDSPRRRGIKQGFFLFLLTFLIVPILIMISIGLNIEPFLPVIGLFLFGVGGVLRIVYALMFEDSGSVSNSVASTPTMSRGAEHAGQLPPSQTMPASAYTSPTAGSWRDTNELQHQPGSVTDQTTKLLQKEEDQ